MTGNFLASKTLGSSISLLLSTMFSIILFTRCSCARYSIYWLSIGYIGCLAKYRASIQRPAGGAALSRVWAKRLEVPGDLPRGVLHPVEERAPPPLVVLP